MKILVFLEGMKSTLENERSSEGNAGRGRTVTRAQRGRSRGKVYDTGALFRGEKLRGIGMFSKRNWGKEWLGWNNIEGDREGRESTVKERILNHEPNKMTFQVGVVH